MERYKDAVARIRAMMTEESVREPYRSYFRSVAAFVCNVDELVQKFTQETMAETSQTEVLKQFNQEIYSEISEGYERSYLNPRYAVKMLGDYGTVFCALYAEIRGCIAWAFEKKYADMAAVLETLVQIYCMFEEEYLDTSIQSGEKILPSEKQIQDVFYSYAFDYCAEVIERSVFEAYHPECSLADQIIRKADLGHTDYLYRFGEYVTEQEIETALYLASQNEETIALMADTMYRGFKEGFRLQGKPYEKKKLVQIEYALGFERVIRRVIERFSEDGIRCIIQRRPQHLVLKKPSNNAGYYVSPNRQYDYDHSYDLALVLGERIAARMLEAREQALKQEKAQAEVFAGPAVMEVFGEPGFEPEDKPEMLRFNEHQKEVYGKYRNDMLLMTKRYVKEEERSFTIIAWPLPSIGKDYKAIFDETIKINTMDMQQYRVIQERIIAALDQASYVEVQGRKNLEDNPYITENETDLKIMLHELKNPDRETNFENCLADVNIPLGEVFTSPVLQGTKGLLHVGSVFVDGFQFKNLKIEFENGRVKEYSCDTEGGKELIRKVIMAEKEHLPLGEFAIGTNTAAYAMAEKFHIGALLPILIAEKMGPHFAVGDTCYSFMEDMHLYNPDGKELVAKDNECSILRKVDPKEAYFACHCDITIPYSELFRITAVKKNGERIDIINNGRFVLEGTETLNEALDTIEQK